MNRHRGDWRVADVAAASAALLAQAWDELAAIDPPERYHLLRLHVEAAVVAYLDGPDADERVAWRPTAEPSRN